MCYEVAMGDVELDEGTRAPWASSCPIPLQIAEGGDLSPQTWSTRTRSSSRRPCELAAWRWALPLGNILQYKLPSPDVMDVVRQRRPRSQHSVTLRVARQYFAKPRSPAYPQPVCILVVPDGDSAHGGSGSDLCRQTCSGPATCLPPAGRIT